MEDMTCLWERKGDGVTGAYFGLGVQYGAKGKTALELGRYLMVNYGCLIHQLALSFNFLNSTNQPSREWV